MARVNEIADAILERFELKCEVTKLLWDIHRLLLAAEQGRFQYEVRARLYDVSTEVSLSKSAGGGEKPDFVLEPALIHAVGLP